MKKYSAILGFILIIIHITISLYLQIKNIDMTEMRLLVTYWKFYISILIPICLIFYGIYEK